MRNRCIRMVLVCLILGLLTSISAVASPKEEYQVLKKIMLGGEGGWDYLTVDSGAHRLYISRSTRVMVVDLDTNTAVGEIPNTAGVHGIALVPELGRGFTSNGREASVTIFDLKSLKPLGSVKTGENPDAIIFDPASKRVFTFNGRSSDTTAIDAAGGTVAGNIPLGGKPEFAVADGNGRIFVNLEDKSEVAVLDSQKLTLKSRWSLAPCEEPSGMAMDKQHHRLFIGCRNKMMAVMDAENGKVVATLPIGTGVDANVFDPDTQLAFSSNGDGTLTVVHEDSPDKFSVVQNVETARGARTMALDPKTHNIYLVTAQFGPPPAATPEQPRPRPSIVPGSFELLIVGKR
ncbi:MAG: YncE family protein [Terriglobia bacterium]